MISRLATLDAWPVSCSTAWAIAASSQAVMKPPCAIVPLVWQYSRRTVKRARTLRLSGSHETTWKLPIDSNKALPERIRASCSSSIVHSLLQR